MIHLPSVMRLVLLSGLALGLPPCDVRGFLLLGCFLDFYNVYNWKPFGVTFPKGDVFHIFGHS